MPQRCQGERRRTRRPGRAALALAAALAAGSPSAQTDREMLDVCLDTFEGERRDGPRFSRDYARHVLYCNFKVDMLEGNTERRTAYEHWRTLVYERDLARLARKPAPAPGGAPASKPPAAPPPTSIDRDTLRFARCLTERADRLALAEPDLDQDRARARLLAEEMAEACLEETGIR